MCNNYKKFTTEKSVTLKLKPSNCLKHRNFSTTKTSAVLKINGRFISNNILLKIKTVHSDFSSISLKKINFVATTNCSIFV